MDPKLSTAQELADETGLHPKRVARYLQLANAPAVVQEAVRVGLTVQVEAEGGEGTHQAQRQLDLLAAIEFSRLHAALSRKEGGGKDEKDDSQAQEPSTSPGEQESEADRRTRQAIERALKEKWGFREVKRYVDKAIAKLEGRKKVGRPRAPFKLRKGWLQVNVERLDALNASQKAELRKVIEQILTRL